MAAAVKENKKTRVRGKLPVKKSINMAVVGVKKVKVSTSILAVILVLAVVAVLGKFFVMDRLDNLQREQNKVRALRTELSEANAQLDSFGELQEKYAHYTFADMTSEELKRVERSDVVDLIERVVLPNAELISWSVKQNQLTLNVTLDTLQDTNLLAQLLNEEDMVEFATVKNAVTQEIKEDTNAAKEASPEGENAEEAPAEEAPAEDTSGEEAPGEGEGEAEGETEGETEGEAEEEKELLFNVSAQIIVYLTQKEG